MREGSKTSGARRREERGRWTDEGGEQSCREGLRGEGEG